MLLFHLQVLSNAQDCALVRQIGADMGMTTSKQDSLGANCCTTSGNGISCDASQRIIRIDWSANVDGNFNLENTLYSALLPRTLLYLNLNGYDSGNSIVGVTSGLPPNLTHLDLGSNQIDAIIVSLPSKLTYINLSQNQFRGTFPSLPNTLTHLDLNANGFEGPVPSFPDTLMYVDLSGNKFTSNIPSPLPSSLNSLLIDDNLMSGDVPQLPNSLQYLSLGSPGESGNHFSGSVIMFSPITLLINVNYITDVVVTDVSQLRECDLSDNPLKDNPYLSNLNKCTQTGLYLPSRLPITKSTSKITSRTLAKSTTAVRSSLLVKPDTGSSRTNSFLLLSTVISANPVGVIQSSKFGSNSTFGTILGSLTSTSDLESLISDVYSTKVNLTSATSADSKSTQDVQNVILNGDPVIMYLLIGGLSGLFVILSVIGRYWKSPVSKSKFGRHNSYGTLNTVQTVKSKEK